MKALIVILSFLTVALNAAPSLKIQGSTTVNPVVSEAAEFFRAKGWKILVDTQGGSSGGITAVAQNQANLGMISKPVSDSDSKKYPNVNFVAHPIGLDGLAVIVSRAVFDGGVKGLSKAQLKDIYEGKIKSWDAVGGKKAPIVFFNKEPGRGTWEVFANYVYGKMDLAPTVTHPEVGSNEEARTKVSGHTSAMSQLSVAWAEGHDAIRPLSIVLEDGKAVPPSRENILNGKYPLARQLSLVTKGPVKGPEKEFVDYLLSEDGQKLLVKHGYLSLNVKP